MPRYQAFGRHIVNASTGVGVATATNTATAREIVDLFNSRPPTLDDIGDLAGRLGQITVGDIVIPVSISRVGTETDMVDAGVLGGPHAFIPGMRELILDIKVSGQPRWTASADHSPAATEDVGYPITAEDELEYGDDL